MIRGFANKKNFEWDKANDIFQVLDGVNRTYETLEGLCTFRCEDGELAEAGTVLIDTKDRHAALVGLSTCDFDK